MDWLQAPEVLCLALFASVILLLLTGYPAAFSLAGGALLFAVLAWLLGVFDISLLRAIPQRIFAIMRNEVLIAVPLFVFMGVMLERSNIAQNLLENMGRLFGAMRGGLGISVCIVGALLAASTGIVGATVVTMGLLSLPTMLRHGYDAKLACGTVCASGTLGQIIPPSIVLILLGDQLSSAYQQAQLQQGNFSPDAVSVNELFAGALLPGLVLVILYIAYQLVVAHVRPSAAPAMSDDTQDNNTPILTLSIFKSLLPPLALIVAVLGSILAGLASPTEAASLGAVGALLLAGHRAQPQKGNPVLIAVISILAMFLLTNVYDLQMHGDQKAIEDQAATIAAFVCVVGLLWGIAVSIVRLYHQTSKENEKVLVAVIRQTLTITSMIFAIVIGASVFSLVFRGLGGDQVIENSLTNLPGGTLTVLLTVMVVMFLLGFILDFLEIVLIVVPIVAPILLTMEIAPGLPISPVWLGVMMAINIQTSFLTPPFGFSLFYLRGVAPSSITTMQIYRGVAPFIIIQLFMLLVLWYWPALATWLPGTIFAQ